MEPVTLLDLLVLRALVRRGPMTIRGLTAAVGRRAPVDPVLRRLERERLVRARPLRRSGPSVRLYRVTGAGREALAALRLFADPAFGV